jgi:GTP-binding protein YchF
MKVGLIGLALSGKTTVFNAVTSGNVEVGGFQSQKGEVHLGRVLVPDERVEWLAELSKSKKITYAEVEYIDVAGFSGEKDRGIEDEIPPALRDCDALAHVIRAFEDPNTVHPKGAVDVRRDIETLDQELIFADLLSVEKRLNKVGRQAKLVKDDAVRGEYELLKKIKGYLEDEKTLRTVELTDEEHKQIKGFRFLSDKPMLLTINIGEDDIPRSKEIESQFAELATPSHTDLVVICGKIEAELAQLSDEDRDVFLADLGLEDTALDRVIKRSYRLLGLISFLTTGDKETRAWTIRNGMNAAEAAGTIHHDFQRGFIRAEVTAYDDIRRCGSIAEAKKQGLVRLEGKNYIVKDGDEILFRFNV